MSENKGSSEVYSNSRNCVDDDGTDSEASTETNSNLSDVTDTTNTSYETTDISKDGLFTTVYKLKNCKNVYIRSSTQNDGTFPPEGKTKTVLSSDPHSLSIINREDWKAHLVRNQIFLEHPVKFVIISHTATKSSSDTTQNKLAVQSIQSYHIGINRNLTDIAYNFLIGCDGKTYEGRGWDYVGEHTTGYNDKAIGISFIGNFLTTLPTDAALLQAKALIKHGVEIGTISENYVLLAHCQCAATESPGKCLFHEIQTWNHWSRTILQ